MRRIRSEQIHSHVSQYTKRRRHMEGDSSKVILKSTDSTDQLSLRNVVASQSSSDNLLAFSSISGDATQCDQQYTRLKTFIGDAIEPYRSELMSILFPMFVHVYLELLCNGQKTPGHKFYSRHHALFSEDTKHSSFLQILSHLYTRQDVLSTPDVTKFRKHKSYIKLSNDSLQYVLRHLRQGDNVLMFQMFNQHFKIQVESELATTCSLDLEENVEAQSWALASPPYTPENKVIQSEHNLSSLQRCIRQVKSGPPCLPSICFYTITNAHQGLCTGCISRDKSVLAGAFEDSTVRLWSLGAALLEPENTDVNVCHIHMGGDYLEDIMEKERAPNPAGTITLRGHSGSVYGVQFSVDNKFLLSCSEDTTVRLWDMESYSNKVLYRGHNYAVWDLDVSTNEYYFASCSQDKTAKLWSLDRTYPLRNLIGHSLDVDTVKFHPNSKYIATGSSDKSVRLWSIEDGKSVRLLQGHRSGVYCLAFAPNGHYLASAGEDRKIRIWDLRQGTLLKELRGHTDMVYSLAFNGDNTLLASGGLDCHIRTWNVTKLANSNQTIDGAVSSELLNSFSTKLCNVSYLNFSRPSLLFGIGSGST